jgi:hypothetical protein
MVDLSEVRTLIEMMGLHRLPAVTLIVPQPVGA